MPDDDRSAPSSADLEELLGFQLKMLMLESDARARKALSPFDISPARVSAMMVIQANPGCTQTALGDALTINRASAMKLVNFLEARGLAERQPGTDMRANALFLTSEGADALKKMKAVLQKVDRQMLSTLSEGEAGVLLDCIRKVRAACSYDASEDEAERMAASS